MGKGKDKRRQDKMEGKGDEKLRRLKEIEERKEENLWREMILLSSYSILHFSLTTLVCR